MQIGEDFEAAELWFPLDAPREIIGPTNVVTGETIQANPWSRESMLMAASRISPETSYRAAVAAQGGAAPVQLTKGPASPSSTEEGIPRAVLIGGGVVAAVAVAAVVYKYFL